MSDFKELKDEELENVNGGYDDVSLGEELKVNDRVEVREPSDLGTWWTATGYVTSVGPVWTRTGKKTYEVWVMRDHYGSSPKKYDIKDVKKI